MLGIPFLSAFAAAKAEGGEDVKARRMNILDSEWLTSITV
jgi:hypothetical protein